MSEAPRKKRPRPDTADKTKLRRADVLAKLRTFEGRLPDDFKFDRDEANSR